MCDRCNRIPCIEVTGEEYVSALAPPDAVDIQDFVEHIEMGMAHYGGLFEGQCRLPEGWEHVFNGPEMLQLWSEHLAEFPMFLLKTWKARYKTDREPGKRPLNFED